MSNIIRFQFKFLETHTHSNENNDKIQQSVVTSNWQGKSRDLFITNKMERSKKRNKKKLNKKQTNILKIVKVSC